MTKVVVLNYGVSRDYIASVHRAGCGAIEKDARDHAAITYAGTSGVGYDSVEEALAAYLDEEMVEMGYSEADVKVHGCCKGVK